MLSTPVIYPEDTVSVYPFNRTLINVETQNAARMEVERFLKAGPRSRIVARKVECVLDRETGQCVPNVFPAGHFMLMWALPIGKQEAETTGDKYTTNNLASDLIMFENRYRPQWAQDVERARAGVATEQDTNVVTGPALLFCVDYAHHTRRYIHADVNLIFRRKMGNWYSASPAPIRPVPIPIEPLKTSEFVFLELGDNGSVKQADPVDKKNEIQILSESGVGGGAGAGGGEGGNDVKQAKDDAEDPFATRVRVRSESELPECLDAVPLKQRKTEGPGELEVSESAAREPDIVSQYAEVVRDTVSVRYSASDNDPVVAENRKSPRKQRPQYTMPLERRVYQTRGRSGIQKVNARYAK